VVTTPQEAAAEVAERAGTMASMMHQRVVGVVENMSYLELPALRLTGSRSSAPAVASAVADTLSQRFGYDVPLLGQIPLDPSLREGGDAGKPIVESDPTSPAPRRSRRIADALSGRGRGLAGMQLGLTPSSKLTPGSALRVFDIGLPELAVIARGVLVFGPDRLPEFAAQAGRFLRRMKKYADTPRATSCARARPGVRRPRAARPRPAHGSCASTSPRRCANDAETTSRGP
jgi:Sec-independent protein translocase protein TatA